MRNLKLNRILEFYDVPQIFVAKDVVDINYLCLLYNHEDSLGYLYIGVQISSKKLELFIKGQIDLRDIYLQPEADNSLYNISVRKNVITAELFSLTEIPGYMLPEEGYFYSIDDEDNEDLISETVECGYPIMRLGFEDLNNSHDINATCLSQVINFYQSMVSNCHKKIYGKDVENQSVLRITTFQAASFNVHFRANTPLNLFGSSDINETFKQVDALLKAPNEEILREKIRFLKGHTISSYKNFINVLLENRLSVKYKWVSSVIDHEVISNQVSLQKLEHIHNVLQETQALATEFREFVGVFLASSVENGKWMMKIDGENRNVNGESINTDILSGIIIEQKKYKIKCREIQEQNTASLKMTQKLILEEIVED